MYKLPRRRNNGNNSTAVHGHVDGNIDATAGYPANKAKGSARMQPVRNVSCHNSPVAVIPRHSLAPAP